MIELERPGIHFGQNREEELLPIARVVSMIGISRSNLYDRISAGEFPKPIPVGRRSLWVLSEVQGWIRAQILKHRSNGHQTGTDEQQKEKAA
mgnify:CR=1 FL=1